MYKNFFFFFFFVIFFVSKTYSSEKIVVVDIQFLVDNSIAGKFLDKKIEKLDKANFDYFQKKEKNFAEKEKKIISQKNVLSDSEYQDKVKNFKDLKKTSFLMVDFSDKVKNSENEIRYFLKTKMYNNKDVLAKNNKGKSTIKKLFNKIKKNPGKFITRDQLVKNKYRAISDFISGMTDRYAINLNNNYK